uniref:Uncharacterized protein n=1 Tax=Aegilops tauschii subsp. strangulata TaxID=200361 RepID=A0A452XYD3_AEGTS
GGHAHAFPFHRTNSDSPHRNRIDRSRPSHHPGVTPVFFPICLCKSKARHMILPRHARDPVRRSTQPIAARGATIIFILLFYKHPLLLLARRETNPRD